MYYTIDKIWVFINGPKYILKYIFKYTDILFIGQHTKYFFATLKLLHNLIRINGILFLLKKKNYDCKKHNFTS